MPVTPFRCASPNVTFDKGELRERLAPLEYNVTQEKGTERPFTNKYYKVVHQVVHYLWLT